MNNIKILWLGFIFKFFDSNFKLTETMCNINKKKAPNKVVNLILTIKYS